MNKIGSFLRTNTPGLYNFLISIFNYFKRAREPYYIYITDSLGGSFKAYFNEKGFEKKLEKLTNGLDEESKKTVDVVVERMKQYPDESQKRKIDKKAPVVGGLLPLETAEEKSIISKKLDQLHSLTHFPRKKMDESVFYFHHGLSVLPDSIKDYVKGQHFVDLGAFIGDSVVALQDFNYSKIFSVEMSLKSIENYKSNMEACGIDKEKYEIINVGIAANDDSEDITLFDTGSSGLSLQRSNGKYDEIKVKQRSLDFLVNQYGMAPKFIKADIEGYGLEFIKGATKTLKEHRPIVSLAIYHNPFEFFEGKPMLEELLEDYTYMIRKMTCGVSRNLCHSEVILLAVPNEIL